MKVFVLKEVNALDTGQVDSFVNLYETEEKALAAMKDDIEELMENYEASIVDGQFGDWEIKLSDAEGSKYHFQIEVALIQ